MATSKSEDKDLLRQYNNIVNKKKELEIREHLLIEKGLTSQDPQTVMKALQAQEIKRNKGSENRKTTFIDPLLFNDEFGYKKAVDKMSYHLLHRMSKTPIINAIIKTRKNQVAAFSEPQEDRFSPGFVIEKKSFYKKPGEKELSKEDLENIEFITEFILNCGVDASWSRDDFDTFLRKMVEDSLIFDQMNFEVVRNRGGELHEFLAVDAMTCRIADSFDDETYEGDREQIGGYYPSYVQVIEERTYAEYYPWELAFGRRNPSTRIHSYNYGRSELEDMVQVVTSQLWADEYNRNFFKQGAAPKGILKVKGGINNPRLNEFKQQWKAMISGVYNAFKTPVIDTEEIDFVDLQKGNKDMEFGRWQDYLIKLACALYTIDPTEIGFASSTGTGDSGSLFEGRSGANEAKLKFSKDKGLKPLLKFIERQINKMVVSQIDNRYRFRFVGYDSETEEQFRARWKDEVSYIKTIDEIRNELDLEPLPNGAGEIIMSPTFTSKLQQDAMMQQQADMFGGGSEEDGGEEQASNLFGEQVDQGSEEAQPLITKSIQNPFEYEFNRYLAELNSEV